MLQEDNIFNTFDKQLYRQGSPVYKGDGNPITDISTIQPSEIGDGFSPGTTEMVQGDLQSGTFLTGVRGWHIDAEGNAEFNDGTFRGTFDIGGTTITIDNTKDIQTYLDIISTAGGGTLYLQNGTYTLTADISIPSGVTIEGVSRDGVIIDCNSSYAVKIAGTNAYSTGTVTINNGDTTVVGSGTTWTSGMVGRFIFLDDDYYEITAFTDTTHLTIAQYVGDNLAGSTYVLATIVTTAKINKVTIQNATGSATVVQYCKEPTLFDLIILDSGTGIDMDYVVFPTIQLSSLSNGIGLDMNYVFGFYIDYSEFSVSTSHGVVMTNCENASFFNSSANDNGGDGINMTNCSQIGFLSNDITGNTGQGVEMVSGCNDNGFSVATILDNGSDGIKLTATSDRNTFVALSITGNGGYGINIADSTCDNNQIVSPAFSGNTSGDIRNLGLNTDMGFQETITQSFTNASASGITNGYSDVRAIGTTGGAVLGLQIQGQPPQITIASTHIAGGDTIDSFVVLGSYVYILVTENSTAPDTKAVYRLDKTNIAAAGTVMTYSGAIALVNANTAIRMTYDGTYFYFTFQAGNSANSYVLSKFTLSGTVFTYVSDVTCGAAAITDIGVVSSGNIYAHSAVDNNDLLKFNSAGTLQTTYDEVLAAGATLVNISNNLYSGTGSTLSRLYLT